MTPDGGPCQESVAGTSATAQNATTELTASSRVAARQNGILVSMFKFVVDAYLRALASGDQRVGTA